MTNAEFFGFDTIVNLTPHTVILLAPDDRQLHSWASAGEARAAVDRVRVAGVVVESSDRDDGYDVVPVWKATFGPPAGLPSWRPRPYGCIVSRITAEAAAAAGRRTDDLLIPDEIVRDVDGIPIGCRAFARL